VLAAAAIAAGVGIAVWAGARAGDSGRASADPAVFLRGIVSRLADNDYAGAWPSLHPAQQRVATRAAYVECEQLTPVPGHLDWIRPAGTKDARIRVAGDGAVAGKAVTFTLKLSEPVSRQSMRRTVTAYAVTVDGRWRWVLPPKRFGVYLAKACPAAPAA